MSVSMQQIKKSDKSHLEYDRSGRTWLLGHPDGRIVSYPAGEEGKEAAQMSVLAHDVPDAAAWIDALLQAYPRNIALHRRAIKAGLIIRDGLILERLPRDYFRVKSQREEKIYLVSLDTNNCHCQCPDWQYTHFDLDRKANAPRVPGLGLVCKHILAAWIVAKLEPLAECPECRGQGFFVFAGDIPGFWTREDCTLCSGSGRVPVDWVEPLLEPGPQPTREKEVLR